MAFEFSLSSTDALDHGDVNAVDALAAMTVCATVKKASLTTTDVIVGKLTGAGSGGWDFFVNATSGLLTWRISTGAALVSVNSTGAMVAGTRHTLGVGYTSGGVVQFVIDGADAGTPTIGAGSIAGSTVVLTIGNIVGSGASLNGIIENVMIWNVKLTLDEIKSYHAGQIPRPSALVFWNPGWEKTMPDLIGNTATTEIGTIVHVDGIGPTVARYPRTNPAFSKTSITALLKILNETLELSEGKLTILGLLQILNETLELSEGNPLTVQGIIQRINEVLQLEDGDGFNVNDPSGRLQETMSDGTVWTTIFPPFTRRTKWTS